MGLKEFAAKQQERSDRFKAAADRKAAIAGAKKAEILARM